MRDPTEDVDRRVVAVEQAGRGDQADLVLGASRLGTSSTEALVLEEQGSGASQESNENY